MNYIETLNVHKLNFRYIKNFFKNYKVLIILIFFIFIIFSTLLSIYFLSKTIYVQGHGILLPEKLNPIYCEVSGKIKRILKNDGDYVKEDDILFEIDVDDLYRSLKILEDRKKYLEINKNLFIEKKVIIQNEYNNNYNFQKIKFENSKILFENESLSKYELMYENSKLFEIINNYQNSINSINISLNEIESNIIELDNKIDEIKTDISKSNCKIFRSGHLIINPNLFREKNDQHFLLPTYQVDQQVSKGEFLGYIYNEDSYIAKIYINEKYIDNLNTNTHCSINLLQKKYSGSIKNIESIGTNGLYTITIKINTNKNLRKFIGSMLNITIKSKKNFIDYFNNL